MTAEEIRKIPVMNERDGTNELLKEIAAQLAELNATLKQGIITRVGLEGTINNPFQAK